MTALRRWLKLVRVEPMLVGMIIGLMTSPRLLAGCSHPIAYAIFAACLTILILRTIKRVRQ